MLTNFSSSFTTQQFGGKLDKKHFPEKHSCEDESNRIPVLGWHWLQPSIWDLTLFPMFFWFPGVVHLKKNIHLAEVNMNAYMLQDSQTCPPHWTLVKEQRQDRGCVCSEPTNTGMLEHPVQVEDPAEDQLHKKNFQALSPLLNSPPEPFQHLSYPFLCVWPPVS